FHHSRSAQPERAADGTQSCLSRQSIGGRMQVNYLKIAAALLFIVWQLPSVRADQAADEATIRANAAKYIEAYNRRDARTMASMWSPDAVYLSPETGEQVMGRDAIFKQIDHGFAGDEDGKLTIHIDSIDFVSPNVAVEKGTAVETYSKSKPEKT